MKVTVKITPVRGASASREVEVREGEPFKDALTRAGIAATGFNFFIGDDTVDISKPLDVKVEAHEVKATERVKGS